MNTISSTNANKRKSYLDDPNDVPVESAKRLKADEDHCSSPVPSTSMDSHSFNSSLSTNAKRKRYSDVSVKLAKKFKSDKDLCSSSAPSANALHLNDSSKSISSTTANGTCDLDDLIHDVGEQSKNNVETDDGVGSSTAPSTSTHSQSNSSISSANFKPKHYLDIIREANEEYEKYLNSNDFRSSGMSSSDCIHCSNSSNVSQVLSNFCDSMLLSKRDPLIYACKNGALEFVRRLVENLKVDINQRFSFQINDIQLTNGTALHAAVIANKMEVVRCLAKYSQLNINAKTTVNSTSGDCEGFTALHLAVSYLSGRTQREMIGCLLAHGADWTITNNAGKQCWELIPINLRTPMKKSIKLTKALLSYGVGLHSINNSTSSNIAHKWASLPHEGAPEVIATAIANGIEMDTPNDSGLTPLMISAIGYDANLGKPNVSVFNQILNQDVRPISRLNRINALELAGATLIFADQLEEGLEYWKKAMTLRFDVSDEPCIPKPAAKLSRIARRVFRNVREVQTKEECENLSVTDEVSLQTQALLAYIRIFGLKHVKTQSFLTKFACYKCTDKREFLNYFKLIFQSCDLTKPYLNMIEELISAFAIDHQPSSSFRMQMDILEQMLGLLQKTTEENTSFIDSLILNVLCFTFDLLDKPLTTHKRIRVKSFLRKAINMKKRDSKGNDLLLLACSSEFRYSWLPPNKRNQSVFEKVISFLLESGADPNSKNADENTAIDVLQQSNEFLSSTRLFYKAGVRRLDQTKCIGETITTEIVRNNGE